MMIQLPGIINVGHRYGAGRRYRVLRIPLGVLNLVMDALEITQPDDSRLTKRSTAEVMLPVEGMFANPVSCASKIKFHRKPASQY